MTEEHKGGNGSRLLTVDMLVKLGLLMIALVLSYQKVQDRQDFLDTRTKSLELWQDTERQLAISLDRRLTILENRDCGSSPNSITLKRR